MRLVDGEGMQGRVRRVARQTRAWSCGLPRLRFRADAASGLEDTEGESAGKAQSRIICMIQARECAKKKKKARSRAYRA